MCLNSDSFCLIAPHITIYDQPAGHKQAALEPNEHYVHFACFVYMHVSKRMIYAKHQMMKALLHATRVDHHKLLQIVHIFSQFMIENGTEI